MTRSIARIVSPTSLFIFVTATAFSTLAFAQTSDKQAAESMASQFLSNFDSGDLRTLYQTKMSAAFQRVNPSPEQFVQQMES
jgi:hypothetical protein